MESAPAAPEHSIVTVLSVDIVGSTHHIAACEPDDAQHFLDDCFEHVRRVVEGAGGLLNSYAGDGGIAVFGWPSALEDHADRACAAAWRIHQDGEREVGPSGEPLKFRVGVHSGLVGLRQLKLPGASEFNTVGATVNLAAKLQQTAPPGGVVVSSATLGLCRNRLAVEPSPTPVIAGLVELAAFVMQAPPDQAGPADAASRYRTPLVGRQAELAALREFLSGGEGRTLALIGEAGIGKSRLANAAVTTAEAAGRRTLEFFGDAQKRATPFAAPVALITHLLALPQASPPEEITRALEAVGLSGEEAQAVAALIGPSRDAQGQLTETLLARTLINALGRLTAGAALLLLVEDLHLVDPESRLFLRLLAQAGPEANIALLLTGRPEALEEAQQISPNVLIVEALPPGDMRDLARSLWPTDVSSELIEPAVRRADGVPFVLEEFARAVSASGPDQARTLPHTVESIIHARLRRLSAPAKALAEALCLLGEEVEIELAQAVAGVEAEVLRGRLDELERFAIVHPVGGKTVRFRHQIIAEACANTIPRQRRSELHRAALAAILDRSQNNLAGRYAQLALHAEGAGDDRAALDYLLKAGVEARAASAGASLTLIFDRALALIERIGPEAENAYVNFVLMLSSSMQVFGEFDRIRAHLPRVMTIARRQRHPNKVANCLSQLGLLCWFEGRHAEGRAATEEGLLLALALRHSDLVFANRLMLANALHGLGRVEEALTELAALRKTLAEMPEGRRTAAPGLPHSMAPSFTCWIMLPTGRYAEALAFGEAGLEVAVRFDDPYSEIMAREALSEGLLRMGRNEEAVACIAAARALVERYGYDASEANLAGQMAMALARTGRPQDAIAIVEACLRARLHLRTGHMENMLLRMGHGEALVGAGEPERGFALLAEALEIARRAESPCLILRVLGVRARLMGEARPRDPQIALDLNEQAEICARFGLAPTAA